MIDSRTVAELDRDAVVLVVPRTVRVGTAVCDPFGLMSTSLGPSACW